MRYKKEIIVSLIISYLGLLGNFILNDTDNPMSYFYIGITLVFLTLSLIFVIKEMGIEENKKDEQ